MKQKVVITDHVLGTQSVEQDILGPDVEIVLLSATKPEDFVGAASDCTALLNTYIGPIDRNVLSQMNDCVIVARYGIGVDTIDIAAATELGILVTNNPSYCIEEVAEHAFALMVSAARQVTAQDRATRQGIWKARGGGMRVMLPRE